MRKISASTWFYYKILKPVSLAIRTNACRRDTFKNFLFGVRKKLYRKIMESLILGKKFFTFGGGCRRIRLVSTTDLWLLNIPGMVLPLFSLFVILKL